jgi:hypothetical protein
MELAAGRSAIISPDSRSLEAAKESEAWPYSLSTAGELGGQPSEFLLRCSA